MTVQSVLEERIENITRERVSVLGSGRTDAGAHALAQVIAFSSSSTLPTQDIRRALNATLPRDIAVTDVFEVGERFHPRFDAESRTYRYVIFNRRAPSPFWHLRAAHVKHRLDEAAMNSAASYLVGSHDFAAFVPVAQAGDSVRTVYEAVCHREDDVISIELRASGFKQQMARTIAGTLVRVGAQRLRPDDIAEILGSRDRRRAGDTMPACGLYLVAVHYPAGTLGERTTGDRDPGAAHLVHGYEEKA